LFVVGLRNDALEAPMLAGELTEGLKNPRAVGVQFRYAFVTDDERFQVLDITRPTKPKLVPGAFIPLKERQAIFISRALTPTLPMVRMALRSLTFPIRRSRSLKDFTTRWKIERHARRAVARSTRRNLRSWPTGKTACKFCR